MLTNYGIKNYKKPSTQHFKKIFIFKHFKVKISCKILFTFVTQIISYISTFIPSRGVDMFFLNFSVLFPLPPRKIPMFALRDKLQDTLSLADCENVDINRASKFSEYKILEPTRHVVWKMYNLLKKKFKK